MPKFNKSSINELKNYLYYSDDHDAEIETWEYNSERSMLTIKGYNPIVNSQIELTFIDVKFFYFKRGKCCGSGNTLNAIVAVDNRLNISNCINFTDNFFDNALYLVFEFFSGDEWHIASQELVFETREGRSTVVAQ